MLTNTQYIDNIIKKVNQKYFIMFNIRNSIMKDTVLLLYKQMISIVPIMEYVGIIMDSSKELTDIKAA